MQVVVLCSILSVSDYIMTFHQFKSACNEYPHQGNIIGHEFYYLIQLKDMLM